MSLRKKFGSYGTLNSLGSGGGQSEPLIRDLCESEFRFLDRDAPFHQSNGRWNLRRRNLTRSLYASDWFHTLINTKLTKILMSFISLYILVVIFFAILYYLFSSKCGLAFESFQDAIYFSLESILTIGYGLPVEMRNPPYFNGCTSALIFLFVESFFGIFFDAVCFGLVFARISRGQTRATTIVFSRFAIIREINGRKCFMFQVAEMRKHQLIEAHVRLYAVSVERCSTSDHGAGGLSSKFGNKYFVRTDAMRTSRPDDELGGMILLALPQVVLHEIDKWSPFYYLSPMKRDISQLKSRSPDSSWKFPEVSQRSIDGFNGNREVKNLKELDADISKDDLQYMLKSLDMEIVVILEGIDAVTSSTVQARHSYKYRDILFDHDFLPSVVSTSEENEEHSFELDFSRFHAVIPLSESQKAGLPLNLFSVS